MRNLEPQTGRRIRVNLILPDVCGIQTLMFYLSNDRVKRAIQG